MIGAMAARKAPNMIRRRQAVGSIPALGLIAWPCRTAAVNSRFVVDDGTIDLRPQFLVNAVLDEPKMRVKVHFDSLSLQRPVWLAKGGAVAVNGVELSPGKNDDADVYVGSVPMDPVLRIEIVRSRSEVTRLEVPLPTYVVDPPKTYRYPDNLNLVLVRLVRASNYKPVSDSFNVSIEYHGSTVHAFGENLFSAGTVLVMKPFRGERAVEGSASALVFRHQRIALSTLTDAYKAGWIVVTVETRFPIDLV